MNPLHSRVNHALWMLHIANPNLIPDTVDVAGYLNQFLVEYLAEDSVKKGSHSFNSLRRTRAHILAPGMASRKSRQRRITSSESGWIT